MIGKSMARGQDQSTPSAGAEAEGRSVGTRSWLILSECHWLTIIGELRSLWFIIILIIALTQLFFELHLFIYLDIFLVKWRLEETKISRKSSWIYFAIQIDKNQVDPSAVQSFEFRLWDQPDHIWIRRHFRQNAAKRRRRCWKAGQPCEDRRCDHSGPGDAMTFLMRQQDLKALELAKDQRKDETIGKLIDHILKKDN